MSENYLKRMDLGLAFFLKYGIIINTCRSGGMADALDSGSSGGNTVRVQVPFSASLISRKKPTVYKVSSYFFYENYHLFFVIV